MFGADNIFFNGIIRKYVIYFGTVFSDLWFQRIDDTEAKIQTMRVPINYGPKDKMLARLEGNPDLERPIAIQVPRMTFEISSFTYDPSRKLNSMGKCKVVTPDGIGYQYNPVPYNIGFRLTLLAKNADDGTRIVEQILPMFTPEFSATLNLVPETGTTADVPIVLNDVSSEDTYEGSFENRRSLTWTFDFTMRAWVYGGVNVANNIIKNIEVNIRQPGIGISAGGATVGDTEVSDKIEVHPGLDANGDPVSWDGAKDSPRRPTDYIDYNRVQPDDDWDFMVDFSGD